MLAERRGDADPWWYATACAECAPGVELADQQFRERTRLLQTTDPEPEAEPELELPREEDGERERYP
ncbi:MAG: hypothetical protein OEO20_11305 [Gemmatimonadota bacterium]|nr:hypothetical protein [Gemmatimonadota bacterium]MDH3291588.1 hypothetical protein [Gemmatimonadota bacterium]MDH3366491.1 hypothetical protein [Gemmatimonadota bacterium]MDH3478880.1 hypothetical protein [Gemmatimonadota bacterium]MDH3570984.1 hypothetical protein [Gemmatimonadota bacterium]